MSVICLWQCYAWFTSKTATISSDKVASRYLIMCHFEVRTWGHAQRVYRLYGRLRGIGSPHESTQGTITSLGSLHSFIILISHAINTEIYRHLHTVRIPCVFWYFWRIPLRTLAGRLSLFLLSFTDLWVYDLSSSTPSIRLTWGIGFCSTAHHIIMILYFMMVTLLVLL